MSEKEIFYETEIERRSAIKNFNIRHYQQFQANSRTTSAILILVIRTSKFGDHYMPVILREQLAVLKQVRGWPPQMTGFYT
jgi:hypothetical protein